MTSRPVAVIESELRRVKILDVRLDKRHVEEDIIRYVQRRLELSSVAPESRPGLQQMIVQKADGLFLYAKLALDYLLHPSTDVQMHLEEMPADLTAVYTNLLREHSSRTGVPVGLQELILQLVTHATRPLRLLEVADLVRVTQGGQRAELGATKDLVRSICGPLLEILPDETVRVVHHSLTEYLHGTTQTLGARSFPVFKPGTTHNHLALLCLSYLATGCLDEVKIQGRHRIRGDFNCVEPSSLVGNQVLPPFAQYAGSQWPVHVQRAITAGHDQAQVNKLLNTVLVGANLDKLDVLTQMRMPYQPSPFHFAIAFDLREYAKELLVQRDLENNYWLSTR